MSTDREPITPFLAKVRALYETRGVSSILVVGGCGDYFDVADCVVLMDSFRASDATADAKRISQQFGGMAVQQDATFPAVRPRFPAQVFPRDERLKVVARADRIITTNPSADDPSTVGDVDLTCVEQLAERSQTRVLAAALTWMDRQVTRAQGGLAVAQLLDQLEAEFDHGAEGAPDDGVACGLDCVLGPGEKSGFLSRPRRIEVAAALNRTRSLRCKLLD